MQPIHALSSGMLPAGVAVLRLSGDGVFDIVRRLIASRRLPEQRRASLRPFRDPATHQLIDRGLVLIFPGPDSFTGEDMAELHAHGGPAVVAALLDALVRLGSRPAEAGEFTRRAFAHGRIDLTEAEALSDLIAAETASQRDLALANAGGRLRQAAEGWRQRLLVLMADWEAHLDFADEGDVAASLEGNLQPARAAARGLANDLARSEAEAPMAERIRHGLVVAIVGPPNAGKSSLLNALAGRQVAIVTAVAGTTRDLVSVPLDLAGRAVTLVDTAGLRETDDPVEREGIARARALAGEADLLLDLGADLPTAQHGGQEIWRLANRLDEREEGTPGASPGWRDGVFHLSALTGAGLDLLIAALAEWAAHRIPSGEPPLVTTARQRLLVAEARAALDAGLAEADPVLAAEHWRLAAHALGRMTGQIDSEELLGAIFSRFCIGK